MIVAITGTPGTGKTAVADSLLKRGYAVKSLDELLECHGLKDDYDPSAGSFVIDVDRINSVYVDGNLIFIEGHLSHHTNCDLIIVLRCHPDLVAERLRERGYSYCKIKENMEAEALDIITVESVMTGKDTFEIDATHLTLHEISEIVIGIINGKNDGYAPGKVNWAEVMMRWD